MNSPAKIWLASPHMGGEEQQFIQEAFDQNWIAPLGPNVTNFEIELQNTLKTNKEIAVLSSGTAALHLAMILLNVQAGDYVICQSMTFSASANPIVYQGALPVFVDSEEDTWNLCPKAVEEAILYCLEKGKKPKAIVAVHLYGMPYQHEAIKALSETYDIPVIEDAAEALGSHYHGQACGTLGDLSILSFNGNKIITTSGGGALITPTKEEKQKAVFLATQAKDDAPHYEHTQLGFNYRMSNICAGIGRGQLKVLDERVRQKREIYDYYANALVDIPGIKLVHTPKKCFNNHWLSTILVDPAQSNGITRENIRLALEAENIESRPLWKPMHLQPFYKEALYFGGTISENLFEQGLCLPSDTKMSHEDLQRIVKVIKSICS